MIFKWRRNARLAVPNTSEPSGEETASTTDPLIGRDPATLTPLDNPARNLPTNRRLREVCLPFAMGRGLEVGPFDRPYFLKVESDVEYLDYRTTEECRAFAEAALGHDHRFVAELDYVVPPDGRWSMVADERFDWILSSHALEHSPNLIGMIRMMASKLKVGGKLISMLPDKRRTFDAFRPVSTLGQILEDEIRDTHFSRPQAVFDQFFYGRALSQTEAQVVNSDAMSVLPADGDFVSAYNLAQESLHRHHDVHNYVFTSHSFEHQASILCANQIIPFRMVYHEQTPDDDMTFINVLEKVAKH